MKSIAAKLYGDQSGIAALEFAILAIPMLLLILGTLEFGRLMWAREALQMTANEGARCMGILASSCASSGAYSSTNTTTYIETVAATWGITLTSSNVALTRPSTNADCTPVSGNSTNMSEVTITYTFETAVPQLLTMLSGGKSLTGHACFPDDS